MCVQRLLLVLYFVGVLALIAAVAFVDSPSPELKLLSLILHLGGMSLVIIIPPLQLVLTQEIKRP